MKKVIMLIISMIMMSGSSYAYDFFEWWDLPCSEVMKVAVGDIKCKQDGMYTVILIGDHDSIYQTSINMINHVYPYNDT
jgi:hypothetical protein